MRRLFDRYKSGIIANPIDIMDPWQAKGHHVAPPLSSAANPAP
jgi:hypothetical protein